MADPVVLMLQASLIFTFHFISELEFDEVDLNRW